MYICSYVYTFRGVADTGANSYSHVVCGITECYTVNKIQIICTQNYALKLNKHYLDPTTYNLYCQSPYNIINFCLPQLSEMRMQNLTT